MAAGLSPPVEPKKGRGKGPPPIPPPPPKGKGRGTVPIKTGDAPRGRGLGALGEDIKDQLSPGLQKAITVLWKLAPPPVKIRQLHFKAENCFLPEVSWQTSWWFLPVSLLGPGQPSANPRRPGCRIQLLHSECPASSTSGFAFYLVYLTQTHCPINGNPDFSCSQFLHRTVGRSEATRSSLSREMIVTSTAI